MTKNLLSAPPTDRITRSPRHTFLLGCRPFTIQPFMLARVGVGDTLTNLYMETRSVVRGLRSPIIGWKQEYLFYYVRATDLALDVFKNMFVDPENEALIPTTTLEDADGNIATYCAPGAIDWTRRALEKVVDFWFRDEGETAFQFVDGAGLPLAQIRDGGWMDTLTPASEMPEGADLSEATTIADLDRLMDAFAQLRALGIQLPSYEDWLRQQGVNIPKAEEGKPEELCRFSEFTYPVNTIDNDADSGTAGQPLSAASWVFKKTLKDPKFFEHPGFIIGIQVTRPKTYFSGLAGSLAGFADRSWDWGLDYLRDMPETRLKEFAYGTGPIPWQADGAGAYVVDMTDDMTHGDQFISHLNWGYTSDPLDDDSSKHMVALPGDDTYDWKYPPAAMLGNYFATGLIETDGFVNLSFKTLLMDHTQGNLAER